jgi:hypothetical protein
VVIDADVDRVLVDILAAFRNEGLDRFTDRRARAFQADTRP